ncbi:MAG: hypothetical protein J3Q66DRAFT_416047 [Benniella sp.]|nr:MAG: hypothetical protein J3Q66DRAFT_416047 [Benniella sp.]
MDNTDIAFARLFPALSAGPFPAPPLPNSSSPLQHGPHSQAMDRPQDMGVGAQAQTHVHGTTLFVPILSQSYPSSPFPSLSPNSQLALIQRLQQKVQQHERQIACLFQLTQLLQQILVVQQHQHQQQQQEQEQRSTQPMAILHSPQFSYPQTSSRQTGLLNGEQQLIQSWSEETPSPFIQIGQSLEEQLEQQNSLKNNKVLPPTQGGRGEEEESEDEIQIGCEIHGTTSVKRTQKIPLELKLEIIVCWEAGEIESMGALSRRFGVSKTTAHRIIKDRQMLKNRANGRSTEE